VSVVKNDIHICFMLYVMLYLPVIAYMKLRSCWIRICAVYHWGLEVNL